MAIHSSTSIHISDQYSDLWFLTSIRLRCFESICYCTGHQSTGMQLPAQARWISSATESCLCAFGSRLPWSNGFFRPWFRQLQPQVAVGRRASEARHWRLEFDWSLGSSLRWHWLLQRRFGRNTAQVVGGDPGLLVCGQLHCAMFDFADSWVLYACEFLICFCYLIHLTFEILHISQF